MSIGYLYVLENRFMPNLYKVGFTTRNLQVRVQELNAQTSTPFPFSTRFAIKLQNPAKAEKAIHELYRYERVNKKKEFFQFNDDFDLGCFLDNVVSVCMVIHNGFDSSDAIATALDNGAGPGGMDHSVYLDQNPEAITLSPFDELDLPDVFGDFPNECNFMRSYLHTLSEKVK